MIELSGQVGAPIESEDGALQSVPVEQPPIGLADGFAVETRALPNRSGTASSHGSQAATTLACKAGPFGFASSSLARATEGKCKFNSCRDREAFLFHVKHVERHTSRCTMVSRPA